MIGMKINNRVKLLLSIVVSLLAGAIGSVFTASAVTGWYATLTKPLLSPPNYVFGPVWTTLYILMGVSLFLVWKRDSFSLFFNREIKKARRVGLILFFVQLFFNTIWSIIFFNFQNTGLALVTIGLLWISIVATALTFYKVSKVAGWLFLPYILWVSFASYLNYAIWSLN